MTAVARRSIACVVAAVCLAACGEDSPAAPVPVVLPTASPSACTRLAQALPDKLRTLPRRRTTPADPRVAAYGDPPLVIRCGVGAPPGYAATSPLVEVQDVAWFQSQQGDKVVWTAPKAFVGVEVTVPTTYPDHGAFLALLAPAVTAAQ